MDQKTDSTHASDLILDHAQRLVQTRGYNAFSYADIARAMNVTTASLHYHFPSKAILGKKLIERYTRRFERALTEIDGLTSEPAAKMKRYVGIYADVLADHRMCLCGILAAEFETLPQSMQEALGHFFDLNERWLTKILESGRDGGKLRMGGPAKEKAQYIIASLEGAMMMARAYGGPSRFKAAIKQLLNEISV